MGDGIRCLQNHRKPGGALSKDGPFFVTRRAFRLSRPALLSPIPMPCRNAHDRQGDRDQFEPSARTPAIWDPNSEPERR